MPSFRASSRASLHVLVIVLAALAMATPFFYRGPACGADFMFHYTSWHDALTAWRAGIFYPHWTSSANFLAGEPRFIFYPPVTWMAGATLAALLPWHLVPVALNLLIFLATGLATSALARRFVSPTCATFAGIVAMFSGYSMFEAYFHSDFALLTGGFWIPLLLLAFFWQPAAHSPRLFALIEPRTLLLALLLAGTWLSNTPLGLMATYLLCTLALLFAWQTRSWGPVLRIAPAIALGLGLAGFYLVPATLQQHWVDIKALISTPEHQFQHRWITSELSNTHDRTRGVIEAVMLLMALGGLAVTYRGRVWPTPAQPEARRRWFALAFLCVAILFLLLPLSYPVWLLVPRLRFLQYPWRWLVVLQAPMAIFVAAAVWSARARWRYAVAAFCTILLLYVSFRWGRSDSRFRACDATSGVFSLAAMDRALQPDGEGVGGFEEYVSPPGANNRLIAMRLPDACLVQDPRIPLSTITAGSEPAFYRPMIWSPALHTCLATFPADPTASRPEHLVLQAQTATAGFLILRLRNYPVWQVRVNGQPAQNLPVRPDGLLAVPVPQGNVKVTVDWATQNDALLGRSLSTLSALLTLALGWGLYRKVRSTAPQPARASL